MENEAHSMSSDIGIGVNEKMVEALESSDNIPLLLTNSGSLKRTGLCCFVFCCIVSWVISNV